MNREERKDLTDKLYAIKHTIHNTHHINSTDDEREMSFLFLRYLLSGRNKLERIKETIVDSENLSALEETFLFELFSWVDNVRKQYKEQDQVYRTSISQNNTEDVQKILKEMYTDMRARFKQTHLCAELEQAFARFDDSDARLRTILDTLFPEDISLVE